MCLLYSFFSRSVQFLVQLNTHIQDWDKTKKNSYGNKTSPIQIPHSKVKIEKMYTTVSETSPSKMAQELETGLSENIKQKKCLETETGLYFAF